MHYMNCAELILRKFAELGVDTCFANPGTSEMHFVSALDRVQHIRCVLGLAETVVTGAADAYGRISGKPALTLLHTGPGLANGLSNLHNAKRGPVPLINVVGDHATYHLSLDAPLTTDVVALARPMSHYVQTYGSPRQVAEQTAKAVEHSLEGGGRVVSLILPADIAWSAAPEQPIKPKAKSQSTGGTANAGEDLVEEAARALLSGKRALVLIGGNLNADLLELAGRIAAKTGARVASEVFPTRLAHGAGRPVVERMPYLPEAMHAFLTDVEELVLLGAAPPVTFFAYPEVDSEVVPGCCRIHQLAGADDDPAEALAALDRVLGTRAGEFRRWDRCLSKPESGQLTPISLAQVLSGLIPEGAILIDESLTSGAHLFSECAASRPHDWLFTTGGSIGWGLPAAVGAAIAAPDRKIIALVGDGSAMYSIQALWSLAREKLNAIAIVLANREYAILKMEYSRMRAVTMGENAQQMMSIENPAICFTDIAQGLGVGAARASTAEEFEIALRNALAADGPSLIEAVLCHEP